MENEQQQFIDKTGDKKYFTIIPNMIVNGYTATESGVYLYIKRKAGENGKFYERARVSAKKLKLNTQTFRKIRDRLVRNGKLEYVGGRKETGNQRGGKQTTKIFKVIDIWEENVKTYRGGENKTTLEPKEVQNEAGKGVQNEATKKNPLKEEPITIASKAGDTFFSFKDYLDGMLKDKQRHIQVIGLYWQFKCYKLENKEQAQSALKRDLRAARELIGYSNERIRETMEWLNDKTDFGWKLETVNKYINEPLDEIKPIRNYKKY